MQTIQTFTMCLKQDWIFISLSNHIHLYKQIFLIKKNLYTKLSFLFNPYLINAIQQYSKFNDTIGFMKLCRGENLAKLHLQQKLKRKKWTVKNKELTFEVVGCDIRRNRNGETGAQVRLSKHCFRKICHLRKQRENPVFSVFAEEVERFLKMK